ncbi:MAG: tRNA (adenosine(37)-N6)-threonylcarbamoyltransferase complex dimerization subunit type 1 TsaB [Sphingobium sp.]
MLRQLVIETATEALSLALFDDEVCVARYHDVIGRGHAEQLMPRIAALPGGGRAGGIAVDTGPGSFTGLRVGLAAARALGYAWEAPVCGFSALAMVALAAQRIHPAEGAEAIVAVITGGHGELFWQKFDRHSLAPLTSPASTPINSLSALVTEHRLYGSGAEVLVTARSFGDAVTLHPDAADFPMLPAAHVRATAAPLYGRNADAVPSAARMTF